MEVKGLRVIPQEIQKQGSKKVAAYLMELVRSGRTEEQYRSKLMVVGEAEKGKTSLLWCLFPLQGLLEAR